MTSLPGNTPPIAITVWKDGTYKVWSEGDATYAANDDNWLLNIPLSNLSTKQLVEELSRREGVVEGCFVEVEDTVRVQVHTKDGVDLSGGMHNSDTGPCIILKVID